MKKQPKRVAHMFETDDMARSVLLGVEIEAVCGFRKRMTRDDLNDLSPYKPCTGCHSGFDALDNGAVLHPRRGWVETLERAMRLRLEAEGAERSRNARVGSWTLTGKLVNGWPTDGGSRGGVA